VIKDVVMHFQDGRAKGHFERLAPVQPTALHSSILLDIEDAEFFVHTMRETEDIYTWQQLEKYRNACEEDIRSSEMGGDYLSMSCSIMSLLCIHKFQKNGTNEDLEADAVRVLGSMAHTVWHLVQKCKTLHGIISDKGGDVERKVEKLIIRGMLSHFCDEIREEIFADDCCCLEGVRYLVDARARHILSVMDDFGANEKMEKNLRQIKHYLLGLQMCLSTVVHGACHGHRGPSLRWLPQVGQVDDD